MQRQLTGIFCVIAFSGLTACSPAPPAVVGDVSLVMNPSGRAPLAGLLTFTTDQPVRVTLEIGDDETSTTVTPKDEFNTEHELMVLGLRAGRTNTIRVSLENESGGATLPPPIEVEAPPLPDDFPPVNVTLSRPALMEPGYTFMPVNGQDADGNDIGKLIAIDAQGEVVWWMEREFADQFRLRNGNLMLFYDQQRQIMREIDMLGNVVQQWHAARIRSESPPDSIPIDIDTIHHDVMELPSGNFLAISSEHRTYDDFPTSVDDPNAPKITDTIISDVIVEFDRDGNVLRRIELLDLIDPYRLGYNSLDDGYYSRIYNEVLDEPAPDFTHGNGFSYLEESDSLVLSLRHIDTVVKINLGEERLEWILGDPTGWREPWRDLVLEPIGNVEWFYGQHAPEVLPSGNVILYDNGSWGRAIPPDPQEPPEMNYSRAVEYAIDEDNMTVRQVWSYGDLESDRFWSAYLGDVDRHLQTGNILITTGAHPVEQDGRLTTSGVWGDGRYTIILSEVTHTNPPQKVWEMKIDDPAGPRAAYRAERLPGLYPNPIP